MAQAISQSKMLGDEGASYRRLSEKENNNNNNTVNKGIVVMQISVLVFSIDKSFKRFSHSSLPVRGRETPLQVGISLKKKKKKR